jgi:hypothetical protein
MAVTPKEDDQHLSLVAEVTLWQEMLEQLIELQQHASVPEPTHM